MTDKNLKYCLHFFLSKHDIIFNSILQYMQTHTATSQEEG